MCPAVSFRLNREERNEIANIGSYQVTNSFVWFKEVRVIARRNKNARFIDSGVFIYGYRFSDQFFKGTNTFSSGDNTMNTSNLAGSVALAFFDTRCSEPAASYQYSPVL
ncbi:hypothetical protein D3C81_1050700 [compost metagenome]